jgi:uncharacterized protein YecE (DUF72 family)
LSYRGWHFEVYPVNIAREAQSTLTRLKTMSETAAKAYIGTSAWVKPQWRGAFYPKGLPQRRELEFASRQLTSLEINSTFYGPPSAITVDKWRDETPDDFVFAVKGHQPVTRWRARNARAPLSDFLASGILRLGDKLGPVLWQLPAERALDLDEMAQFVALLPRSIGEACALATESTRAEWQDTGLADRPMRHAVEIRNATFVDARFVELMHASNIAIAHANGPGHPQLHEQTSDFAYVRLSSGPGHFDEGYDDETLDQWAAQVDRWLGEKRDVYVYFNNPDGDLPHTPFNALRLIERLGGGTPRADAGQLF